MAFCPNCGTPNTEQAERCVACGFELIVPKQKAKFKGTIMMSGIKAPAPQPEPAKPPVSQPPPPSQPPAPVPTHSVNYKKTMLGQPPIALPSRPEARGASPREQTSEPLVSAPPAASYPRESDHADLGTMPTMQGQSPMSLPPQQPSVPPYANANTRDFQPSLAFSNPLGETRDMPSPPPPSAPAPSTPTPSPHAAFTQPSPVYGASGTFAGNSTFPGKSGNTMGSMGGAYESTVPPTSGAPSPAKVVAIGCAVVLALFLVVGGALWFAFGDRLKALFGGASEASAAEAAAWHASIAQSLTKVNELCATDCAQAGVFFHPLKQAALLGEARALTPARVAKLNDPSSANAAMLDHTDDSAVATQLGLDPQQCARVTASGAKVISCSVPDPSGKPSVLRIVQLSGIDKL